MRHIKEVNGIVLPLGVDNPFEEVLLHMGNRFGTNEASTQAWRNGEKDYPNEQK